MIGIEQVKQYWATPAKIAVWLTALVGLFLLPPPRLWHSTSELAMTSDPAQWLRLSQFLIAIVVGLFFLRRAGAVSTVRWRAIALGAALVGVVLFVVIQFLTPAWTCGYINEVVIKGATYSDDARAWVASGADCTRLIGLASGATAEVWPERELVMRFIILAGLYTLTMLAFAVAALATIEFVRLGHATRGGRRGR